MDEVVFSEAPENKKPPGGPGGFQSCLRMGKKAMRKDFLTT
jgi:hypothetical protein